MVDLSVKIGDITLQNPVQPASGAFSWEYNDVIDLNRLGALVAKTICREPRLGNPTPRMAETEAGIIQSIGLPGKGIEYFLDHIVPEYAKFKPPLVVSVNSETIEDFAALAEELSVPDVDVIEANISCPTRNQTGGNFAMHEDYTRDCISAIRAKTKKPLWVKLSPNAGDIVSIGKAAEAAGADCLVIANTFLSLKIRTDNFRPALGNKFGGLVSPALKPIVLRMVYQVAKAVKIPIIGIGGVTKAEDVVEYMLAGASAVGIGYAGFRNPTALITDHRRPRSLVRRTRHQEGHRTDRRGERRRHGDGYSRRRISGRLSRRHADPLWRAHSSNWSPTRSRITRPDGSIKPRRPTVTLWLFLRVMPPSPTISAWSPRRRATIVRPSAISTLRSRPSRNTRRRITTAPSRCRRSANRGTPSQSFERVCAIEPGHYDAHRALGFLWLAEGDRGRALDHFARTYELRRGEDRTGIAAKCLTEATRTSCCMTRSSFVFWRSAAATVSASRRWRGTTSRWRKTFRKKPCRFPTNSSTRSARTTTPRSIFAAHRSLRVRPSASGRTTTP